MRIAILILSNFICLLLFGQTPLFERFELGSNKLTSSLASTDGRLFFGTADGLYQLDGFDFRQINKEALSVNTLLEDVSTGQVYLFSNTKGLYTVGKDRLKGFEFNHELKAIIKDDQLNEIALQDSSIWFSMIKSGGLYVIDLKSGIIKKHMFTETTQYAYFSYEISSRKFISGSNEAGLFENKLRIFKGAQLQELRLSDSKGRKKSRSLVLRDGSLLFSVGPELLHVSGNKVLSRLFQERNISCIHEDIEGKLWVGLETEGLVCYPNSLEESSNRIRYLSTTGVNSIAENNIGELWISTTTEGIYEFNPGTSTSYQAPVLFSDLDTSGGPSQAIPIEDSDLRIKGNLNPNAVVRDSLPPQIFITGVRIMGEDTSILSSYELDHRQNFIEISYLGFAQASNMIQYRYRLIGANDDWVYTSRPLVQYTTLPPGKYYFFVEAVNKDGIWSEQPATLNFVINPPFWQTTWFRSLLVILIVLLGSGIWSISYLRLKRKSERRDEYNRKLAEVELQALRAQMNPHFLFNTLSSIQHFITLSRSEEAINYLSKFAKLMRVILENSKSPEIALKDELNALEIYLELESLRFKDKFDYEIKVDDALDRNYDMIPPLLIQPYVENAIMHGIMHLKKKGHISVTLERQGDKMKVSIRDNGVGRKRSKEFEDQKMHKSRGMSITRDRLEIINTSRKSNLSLSITDLESENSEPEGTLVEIFIPIED